MSKLAHEALRRKIGDSRVGRSPLRDVAFVSDLFARLLNERLRNLLRWHIVVSVEENEVMKLSAAADRCAAGSIYAVIDSDNSFGGMIILERAFLFRWLEAFTGCDGSIEGEVDERDLTSIDTLLAEDFVKSAIECFEKSVVPEGAATDQGSLKFSRFVKNRSSIIDAEDMMDVLNIRLGVKIGGDAQRHDFDLFVPLGVLDVYKAAEKAAMPSKAEVKKNESLWASTMLKAVNEAEYRMVAVLHEKKMNVGDIKDLKVGSMIALPHERRMPVELRIDSKEGVAGSASVANGMLGVIDGYRAVRMTEPPAPEFTAHLQRYSMAMADETQDARASGLQKQAS